MVQDKESAAKAAIAVDAYTSTEGDTQNPTPAAAQDAKVGGGGGADLDAYIKNLLSSPALGEVTVSEEQGAGSPIGEYKHHALPLLVIFVNFVFSTAHFQ